jgi:hypothetical protein
MQATQATLLPITEIIVAHSNRQFQLLWEVRYHIADYAENFNKNYRNNRNISIFTSISYHSVITRPPFLFFQHNQQYDTLLPIIPCTHKLKAGIAYFVQNHANF